MVSSCSKLYPLKILEIKYPITKKFQITRRYKDYFTTRWQCWPKNARNQCKHPFSLMWLISICLSKGRTSEKARNCTAMQRIAVSDDLCYFTKHFFFLLQLSIYWCFSQSTRFSSHEITEIIRNSRPGPGVQGIVAREEIQCIWTAKGLQIPAMPPRRSLAM